MESLPSPRTSDGTFFQEWIDSSRLSGADRKLGESPSSRGSWWHSRQDCFLLYGEIDRLRSWSRHYGHKRDTPECPKKSVEPGPREYQRGSLALPDTPTLQDTRMEEPLPASVG